MGLTLDPVPTTATTTATPDKQIAARYVSGGTGTVLYTVPSGRKFKGILTNPFGQSTSGFPVAQINGLNVDWFPTSGPLHIELAEGAIVQASNSTYATGVYGVESDA